MCRRAKTESEVIAPLLDQYPQLKRLGNIVVTAYIQPHDDAYFLVRCCQKDDWNLRDFSNPFAEIETGTIRQRYIQDQQVIRYCPVYAICPFA